MRCSVFLFFFLFFCPLSGCFTLSLVLGIYMANVDGRHGQAGVGSVRTGTSRTGVTPNSIMNSPLLCSYWMAFQKIKYSTQLAEQFGLGFLPQEQKYAHPRIFPVAALFALRLGAIHLTGSRPQPRLGHRSNIRQNNFIPPSWPCLILFGTFYVRGIFYVERILLPHFMIGLNLSLGCSWVLFRAFTYKRKKHRCVT